MKKTLLLIISVALGQITFAATDTTSKEITITSPDGHLSATFGQTNHSGETLEKRSCTIYDNYYYMSLDGKTVIEKSHYGLNLDNREWEMALGYRLLPQYEHWMDALELDSIVTFPTVKSSYTPIFGDQASYPENYNSCTLFMSRKPEKKIDELSAPIRPSDLPKDGIVKSQYRINIEVRMYNEGLAFRYWFPEHPDAIFHKIVEDETEYNMPEGTMAWSQQWAQARHEYKKVSQLNRPVEMALTMKNGNGVWTSLLSADIDEWCHTKLQTKSDNTIKSVMCSPVDAVTYFGSPWKIIMAANTPGELLEHNYIVELLNPESQLPDAAEWCIPGKMIRCMTLSNEGGRAYIDFCAKHNIEYILFCWKWYMPVTSFDGDATKPVPGLNIKEMCEYAKSKGVKVWVYLNQHSLMKQMDEVFPLLKEWGVVGIKPGFVEFKTHHWSVWVHDLVRKAAEYKFMVDIHDEYRPNGFSRTYPNLMTQEGICGSEEFPDATHNVTLPFTRMINGSADYTIAYFDKRLLTTHAHQLAASMMFYCPVPSIFWYDKPSDEQDEPELTWFDNLETVWDESHVLSGHPGEHIVMARRNGTRWFVGAMTNNDARSIDIPLNFLIPGKTYKVYTYTDDPTVDTRTHVRCSERIVKVGKKGIKPLHYDLLPSGGVAIRIEEN